MTRARWRDRARSMTRRSGAPWLQTCGSLPLRCILRSIRSSRSEVFEHLSGGRCERCGEVRADRPDRRLVGGSGSPRRARTGELGGFRRLPPGRRRTRPHLPPPRPRGAFARSRSPRGRESLRARSAFAVLVLAVSRRRRAGRSSARPFLPSAVGLGHHPSASRHPPPRAPAQPADRKEPRRLHGAAAMSEAALDRFDDEGLERTASTILATQRDDGAIPWFVGGRLDPWNHVEAAMALAAAGEVEGARLAFRWLAGHQRVDGSWFAAYSGDASVLEDHCDTNATAYVATGLHLYLAATGTGNSFESASAPSSARSISSRATSMNAGCCRGQSDQERPSHQTACSRPALQSWAAFDRVRSFQLRWASHAQHGSRPRIGWRA